MSRPGLSAALGLPKNAIEKFETGRQTPNQEQQEKLARDTLRDHALLLEFFARRDGVGAEHAMAIHMAHAMDEMGLEAGQHSGSGCHS